MTVRATTPDEMHFTIRESRLGLVLVAQTGTGISAVMLDGSRDMLQSALEQRFPSATLIEGGGGIEESARKVIDFIESPALGLDVPLDMRGTAFQRTVWEALRQIPVGSTASYTEVARQLGMPRAARAVAAACAANPIAVAVPCHRVVSRDGGLAGYRWGVERKRALLETERRSLTVDIVQ